ncbi:MAG: putative beta-lysine N-acetyltransferase [Phycisphaerae bacterium]|nr:putative beta-lysine N-acetyltransferase [Phycisphaerae bacterium]
MKLSNAEPQSIIPELKTLARRKGYTKIFAKVPQPKVSPFKEAGYRVEARVPGFFKGEETACFLGYYLNPKRQVPRDKGKLDTVLSIAQAKTHQPCRTKPTPPKLTLKKCRPQDASAMSRLYKKVFPSYPFPIDDPGYIQQTMQTHIQYYAFESNGQLLALSSAEMDPKQKNVEMTDFATLPPYRGQGLAVQLLRHMETQMAAQGMTTAYTIARALSPGMNITFAKRDYQYNGRLINNTHIAGQIESMNVWSKGLSGV